MTGRMHTFVSNNRTSYGVDVEPITDDATSEDYLRYRAWTTVAPEGLVVDATADSWCEAVDALRDALVARGLL